MEAWTHKIIVQFREYRQKTLHPAAEFFKRIGVTANIITFLSLLCGIAAVYFMFHDYILFLLFGSLHLIADSLDGVIARLSTPTHYGKYLDWASDQLVTILLVIKIGYFLDDYYAYIVAGLYLLAQIDYLLSRLNAPILFGRSASLIALFLYVPTLIKVTSYLPVLVYLFIGIISVYSLARQLQWKMWNSKV